LTLRTNQNLQLWLYSAFRALYFETLFDGGFDDFVGTNNQTYVNLLQSTLSIDIPVNNPSGVVSTSAYAKYQNGTWPRPYEEWYPVQASDTSQTVDPVVARFLANVTLEFVQTKFGGDPATVLAAAESEITAVLTNGTLYSCQVCGNHDYLNSFFAAAPWAHLLAAVVFFLFSRALRAMDRARGVAAHFRRARLAVAARRDLERGDRASGGGSTRQPAAAPPSGAMFGGRSASLGAKAGSSGSLLGTQRSAAELAVAGLTRMPASAGRAAASAAAAVTSAGARAVLGLK
ncbi:hypothetical protein HK405_002175, partial [Cladochytrium tenue]